MSYEIVVGFQSNRPASEIVELMQEVYDRNGVDGMFFVEPNPEGRRGWLQARFHRETQDDWEYVATRAINAGAGRSISNSEVFVAAIEQLRDELQIYDPPEALSPLIDRLQTPSACRARNFDELYKACLSGVESFKPYLMNFSRDVPAHGRVHFYAGDGCKNDPQYLVSLAKAAKDGITFMPDWRAAGPIRLAGVSLHGHVIQGVEDVRIEGKDGVDPVELRQFVEMVASLTKDREIVDGKVFDLASDDAVDTLHSLISRARSLMGEPEDLLSEGDDNEERGETPTSPVYKQMNG